MKSCFQFPSKTTNEQRREIEPWDEIIYESENFVAVPTRGALIEGWLLIVPRAHHFCIGEFGPELFAEFQLFRREVQGAIETTYGGSVAFEHGPASSQRPAGCGVDHAHLHIVPWHGSFAGAVREHGSPKFAWRSVTGCEALRAFHDRGEDYLYFEESDGNAFATSGPIPSQYFRRIVASELGESELFDWKTHSGINTVRATLAELGTACRRAVTV